MIKQEQKVIEYFIQNNNDPKHFEKVANDLNILVPNVRRILGQGTLKGVFNRVAVGVYEFAHYETNCFGCGGTGLQELQDEGNASEIAPCDFCETEQETELSRKTALKLNDILINDNGNISINKDDFNSLLNTVNDNEKEILKTIIK